MVHRFHGHNDIEPGKPFKPSSKATYRLHEVYEQILPKRYPSVWRELEELHPRCSEPFSRKWKWGHTPRRNTTRCSKDVTLLGAPRVKKFLVDHMYAIWSLLSMICDLRTMKRCLVTVYQWSFQRLEAHLADG